MGRSAFLDLPSEIRGLIYRHVFAYESVSVRWGGHLRRRSLTNSANIERLPSLDHHQQNHPLPKIISILLVCRTTYVEATPYLYSHISVVFASDRIANAGCGHQGNEIEALSTANQFHTSSLQTWIYFPWYLTAIKTVIYHTPRLSTVRHVYYTGSDSDVLANLTLLFPRLEYFQLDLGWDHVGNDQTNFDRAVKYARRVGEWKVAVRDALRDRFSEGVMKQVAKMKKKGRVKRGFVIELRWRLGYRFVEFEGLCDLDEWVLRVRDAENPSSNVYDIKLDPLEVKTTESN